MSRNRTSKVFTTTKQTKFSKGGYLLTRNGVPVTRKGMNALKSNNYAF